MQVSSPRCSARRSASAKPRFECPLVAYPSTGRSRNRATGTAAGPSRWTPHRAGHPDGGNGSPARQAASRTGTAPRCDRRPRRCAPARHPGHRQGPPCASRCPTRLRLPISRSTTCSAGSRSRRYTPARDPVVDGRSRPDRLAAESGHVRDDRGLGAHSDNPCRLRHPTRDLAARKPGKGQVSRTLGSSPTAASPSGCPARLPLPGVAGNARRCWVEPLVDEAGVAWVADRACEHLQLGMLVGGVQTRHRRGGRAEVGSRCVGGNQRDASGHLLRPLESHDRGEHRHPERGGSALHDVAEAAPPADRAVTPLSGVTSASVTPGRATTPLCHQHGAFSTSFRHPVARRPPDRAMAQSTSTSWRELRWGPSCASRLARSWQ